MGSIQDKEESENEYEVLPSVNESETVGSDTEKSSLPELDCPSEILEKSHIEKLHVQLPERFVESSWKRLFSTEDHGFKLTRLYRLVQSCKTSILLVIKDEEGAVFGAMLNETLRLSRYFYGSGESFLYTFHPEFEVFKWTNVNEYFIKGGINYFALGAGDGDYGLWINGCLTRGKSRKCLTFDNGVLSKSEDFDISAVEVWTFVPTCL